MEYAILIDYQTGNSFGSENLETELEIKWSDVDVARENLIRISEHYKMYLAIENGDNKAKILQEVDGKAWFCKKERIWSTEYNEVIDDRLASCYDADKLVSKIDWHTTSYALYLKTDSGKEVKYSPFWIGYFERLYEAKIIIKADEMSVTF